MVKGVGTSNASLKEKRYKYGLKLMSTSSIRENGMKMLLQIAKMNKKKKTLIEDLMVMADEDRKNSWSFSKGFDTQFLTDPCDAGSSGTMREDLPCWHAISTHVRKC